MEKIRNEAPSITTTDWSEEKDDASVEEGNMMQEDFAADPEEKEEEDTSEWPQAGGPIFNPPGGTLRNELSLDVYSLMGSDSVVHYTIDGSEPSNRSASFPKEEKLHINHSGKFTIKACVSAPGFRDSVSVEMVYIIQRDASAPEVSAKKLGRWRANISAPGSTYLGSFEEQVEVRMSSGVPGASILYTVDGSDPDPAAAGGGDEKDTKSKEARRGSIESLGRAARTVAGVVKAASRALSAKAQTQVCHDGHIVLSDPKNYTLKAIVIAEGYFPSPVLTRYVAVLPRPPRPRYLLRTDEDLAIDLHVTYHRIVDQRKSDALYPADIDTFVEEVLNPDAGKCPECTITPEERTVMLDAVKQFKDHEGLHASDDIKLYHGFLSRGSCFGFVRRLNQEMFRMRKNITLHNFTIGNYEMDDL